MIRTALLCAAALVPASSAVAQLGHLPPEAIVISALENHPAVSAATARITSARAQEQMLRRGPSEFTFQGTVSERSVSADRDYAEYDVNLTRPFRLPGKAALDRKSGQLGVAVAVNLMADVRHQTALSFANLWHDWLIASALHRTDLETAAYLREELKAIRRRTALKDASELDVNQADAALALAEGMAATSLSARDEARAKLMATFPEIVLSDTPVDLPEPTLASEALDTMRAEVIERSHEIRAAEREAERRGVVARRVRSDRIPDPSLGVRVFSERSGLERGAGVVFSLPFAGGYRRAASDQAFSDANAAELEVYNVKRQVEATASADISNVRTRVDVWRNMRAAANSAAVAASRTQKGYSLGQIDLTETLLVRRQANEAKRAEIQARGESLRAIVKLEIDAHRIWLNDDVHVD